jgi:hypothetical protein
LGQSAAWYFSPACSKMIDWILVAICRVVSFRRRSRSFVFNLTLF